jgi:hypothetical protein
MADEREDLVNLLTHPGFLRLQDFARRMWKDDVELHLAQATNDRDDFTALHKLRQVLMARKAIEQLMSWPGERVQKIDAKIEQDQSPAGQSRRGPL